MNDNKRTLDDDLTIGAMEEKTVALNSKKSDSINNEATYFFASNDTIKESEEKTVLIKPEMPAVFCKSCGTKNNVNATFCTRCGASLVEKRCPKCGAIIEGQYGFCTKCGYSFKEAESPKKNNTLLIAAISIVACLTLVIACVIFINNQGDDASMQDHTVLEETSETKKEDTPKELAIPKNPNQDFTGTPTNNQVVKFGMYEIDGDISNGKEPIEWTAFYSETDSRIVLICNYVLDYQEYGSGEWQTCSLRKWLNNEFLNEAFDSDERSRIPTTSNDNSSISFGGYTTVAGSPTNDRVFIMRANALSIYFSDLSAPTTPYAKQLAGTSSNLPYSTRGMISGSGPVVSPNGSITDSSSTKLGVRPCIFII